MAALAKVPDWRNRRGIRQSQVSILAVAVCGVMAGSRSFRAIADFAAGLDGEVLLRLGCRPSSVGRRLRPPSEPTIRRALTRIDAEALDGVLSLPADRADGARVLTLVRGHRMIEALHHIRAVTYDEVRCRIRTGNAPRAMATLRNLAPARRHSSPKPLAGDEPPATAHADRCLTTGVTGLACLGPPGLVQRRQFELRRTLLALAGAIHPAQDS